MSSPPAYDDILGHRLRVNRLLQGGRRAEDLMHLFLFAREKNDGRHTIRELGDFCAHQGTRNRGILNNAAKVVFAKGLYIHKMIHMKGSSQSLDFSKLPLYFREVLVDARDHVAEDELKRYGIKRAVCFTLVGRILKKFRENEDGTLALTDLKTGLLMLSPEEGSLLNLLMTVVRTSAAFSGEKLVEDFIAVLRSNNLLKRAEVIHFRMATSVLIQLFAICQFHRAKLQISEDNRPCHLSLSFHNYDIEGKTLLRMHVCPVTFFPGTNPPIGFTSPVFTTNLNPHDYCEESVILKGEDLVTYPLEISLSGKISLLE